MGRGTSGCSETVSVIAEEMYDGLLERVRTHVAEHNGTFWDMFSGGESTEPRRFFLSLPEEQREFLRLAATAEALLAS